jgi:hypothetical protein
MTVLAPTTTRPRSSHLDARSAPARVADLAAAVVAVVRETWRSIAEDGQLGSSADLPAARFSGARA